MPITQLADIRAEGITDAMASDAAVNAAIVTWESVFFEACGQWFEPVSAAMTFDGDNSSSAFFRIPIISIDSLEDLELGTTLSTDDYVVYNGRTLLQDDRRHPRIMLKKGRCFNLGRGRYRATGSWGFVEADDSPPPQVQYALLKLVIEKLLSPIVPSLAPATLPDLPTITGQLVAEETDEHRLAWANPNNSKITKDINDGLTRDPFILETIQRFQAPMSISAPVTWDFYAQDRNVFDEVF